MEWEWKATNENDYKLFPMNHSVRVRDVKGRAGKEENGRTRQEEITTKTKSKRDQNGQEETRRNEAGQYEIK